ncbi:MAG: cobalamin synthesis protein P47K [Prevotellaceae bacterium]|nr:cobalamin synthesis protein P47K [Prevotellaceae bacterium]
MKTARIIFTGGFLGAGKTTLLREAAQRLMKQGFNVGLITNDQAPELVDSMLLSKHGLKVSEVSGSCFCCNFNGLTAAIQHLRTESATDIIIAEPVGSCTDLSATIMQPLKQFRSRELNIAPLSVLADPARLTAILDGGNAGLHDDAAYIYRKQLEESDIILITKSDLLTRQEADALQKRTAQAYPHADILTVSAVTGDGIDRWLDEALKRNDAGLRLADVNYDIYARGEAVLGWLNGSVRIKGEATEWDAFIHDFLAELSNRFDANNYSVGHVKIIAESGSRYITGNITGLGDTLSLRGSIGKSNEIKLVINARVETAPEELDKIIKESLNNLTDNKYSTEVIAWRHLQPGRPNPAHRFVKVVQDSHNYID